MASPAPSAPTESKGKITLTIGPMFIGLLMNYVLWGIQMSQMFRYYRNFRKIDPTWVKAAVFLLFVADIVGSVCISQACWIIVVSGWGDQRNLTFNPAWGLFATPLVAAFTASIAHVVYAQKIYGTLNVPFNSILTIIVLAGSLTQLTAGAGSTIFINLFLDPSRSKTWISVWVIGAAVTDLIITGVIMTKLFDSWTGFKKTTDDILTKALRLTIETALALTFVQILDAVIYLTWPNQSYHLILSFMAPKMYGNSMLAFLNSRENRNGSTVAWYEPSPERRVGSIHIHTTRTVDVDDSYELTKSKYMSKGPRTANETIAAPQLESRNSLPVTMLEARAL